MTCPLGVRINRVPLYNFLVSTSRKKLPTFHELNLRWSKRDKVWSSTNSLFKWRFRRCRRRCYLLGSIMKCIRESPPSWVLLVRSPTPNVPRSNISTITWWSDQHSAVERSPSITKWLSESLSKIMCQRFDGHFLLSPRWPLWGGSFVLYLIRKLFFRWYLSVTLTRWS